MFTAERGIVIVPYGCDFSFDRKNQELILGEESKKRLRKAWEFANREMSRGTLCIFVVTAGFCLSIPNQKQRMAEMMAEYLDDISKGRAHVFVPPHVPEENVWGSDAETRAAISTIKELQVKRDIILVTHWYHVPRVRLLWWCNLAHHRRQWHVRYISCRGGNARAVLWEIMNLTGTLCGFRTSPFKSR